MDTELQLLIENSICGNLYDIAQVIYFILKTEYVSARLKNKLWFKFDGNKWCQVEEGPYYELSTRIVAYYESFLKELLLKENLLKTSKNEETFLENQDVQKEDELKFVQNGISKTTNIIDRLKNVNFKESLCKECLYLFYDRDFISNLDKKDNLIVFKDSIYDLKSKTLRNGEKSDMVSIYIDITYDSVIKSDEVNYEELVTDFIQFRKNLLKKRHPKHVYTLSYF